MENVFNLAKHLKDARKFHQKCQLFATDIEAILIMYNIIRDNLDFLHYDKDHQVFVRLVINSATLQFSEIKISPYTTNHARLKTLFTMLYTDIHENMLKGLLGRFDDEVLKRIEVELQANYSHVNGNVINIFKYLMNLKKEFLFEDYTFGMSYSGTNYDNVSVLLESITTNFQKKGVFEVIGYQFPDVTISKYSYTPQLVKSLKFSPNSSFYKYTISKKFIETTGLAARMYKLHYEFNQPFMIIPD